MPKVTKDVVIHTACSVFEMSLYRDGQRVATAYGKTEKECNDCADLIIIALTEL